MRTLLLSLLVVCPLAAFSQFFGVSASYVYDGQFGNHWRNGRGIQLGVGAENLLFDNAPLSYSMRYIGSFTKSRYNTKINDVAFDLPDSMGHVNNMGFANLDFKKFSFGLEMDLGYQDWEYAVFEPYVSLGGRFQSYGSWLKYELYEPDSCHCFDTEAKEFTETKVLSFTSGVGFKIRPTETFYIDFRATYYGGWGMSSKGSNPYMPDTDSFHINAAGEPTVNYSPRKYNHGMTFNVGIIFRIRSNSDSFSFFNSDDSDDSNDSDESDDSDSYERDDSDSNSSSGSDCGPIELTPSGRKDPPRRR